jgi:type III secretory pathway component EscV
MDAVDRLMSSPWGFVAVVVVGFCLMMAFGVKRGFIITLFVFIALAVAIGYAKHNTPATPTKSPGVTAPVTTSSPEHKVPVPHNP